MTSVRFRPIRDVIHKTGSTQHIALASAKDRAMATGKLYRKCGEIWTSGFYDMQVYRQTERQTYGRRTIKTT